MSCSKLLKVKIILFWIKGLNCLWICFREADFFHTNFLHISCKKLITIFQVIVSSAATKIVTLSSLEKNLSDRSFSIGPLQKQKVLLKMKDLVISTFFHIHIIQMIFLFLCWKREFITICKRKWNLAQNPVFVQNSQFHISC